MPACQTRAITHFYLKVSDIIGIYCTKPTWNFMVSKHNSNSFQFLTLWSTCITLEIHNAKIFTKILRTWYICYYKYVLKVAQSTLRHKNHREHTRTPKTHIQNKLQVMALHFSVDSLILDASFFIYTQENRQKIDFVMFS